eukprot:TRINITY_DN3154_c0_g1_i1.p1 TRINITY_DN3154_c0_g1~~TRINITY_DN3154_c0_g1_i1.p1  ORF type:complete len:135 (-),score=41.13 TRINITY_DN3154_c0_g1_i1:92-496(-)
MVEKLEEEERPVGLDPWNQESPQPIIDGLPSKGGGGGFDDNFSDRLPDSAEYLKRLESKLTRIQSGNKKKSSNEIKEDLMRQLLCNEEESEYIDSANIDPSRLASRIQPMQALNTLELELLLSKKEEENDVMET